MNPFPDVDPFMQTPFGNIPHFPIDMKTSEPTSNGVGWPSVENNIMSNIPISQPSFYSSSNMMDNQQAQIAMLMMQQQQLHQQQQQQQIQQQQLQRQQQHHYMLSQQQQQQQQTQYQIPKHVSPYQMNSNIAQQQAPHWFLKQQQAKMMAAQEKMKNASSVPSLNSFSASSSSMHSSPLLDGSLPSNVIMPSTPQVEPLSPSIIPESDLLSAKRVEAILTINQEIIRLCLEHQQMNTNELKEPDISIYKSRLQSNLTYLATMADISMTKAEENFKVPAPPNLSTLPPPFTMTGHRIHKLLQSVNQLFMGDTEEPDMSPYPQKQGYNKSMMMQQRQQYNSGIDSVGSMSSNSSSTNNNMLSPHHLHHALLKNNQNIDSMQQMNSGMINNNFMMDDTAMMMMMYNNAQ